MKMIHVGIIGMGFIGALHYEALRQIPYICIRSICVSNSEKINEVKETYGVEIVTDNWQDIVNDPMIDVIHNCTPNILHDEINMAAIKMGKHIYTEKPLSMTSGDAYKVWSYAKKCHVAHGVNLQYRMNAAVQEMYWRIKAGQDGMPLFVRGNYYQDSVAKQSDYTKRQIPETSPARALLDIGVHWSDTASFIMNQPIKKVYANMYTHYPVRIDPITGNSINIHSDDTTTVVLEFEDGTPGMACFSKCFMGHKNDLSVTIDTSMHEYTWRQEECDRLLIGNRNIGNETYYVNKRDCKQEVLPFINLPAGHAAGWKDALKNAMYAFYTSIQDHTYEQESQVYATMKDGWMASCFVDACLLSAKEKREVLLKEVQG